MNLRLAILRAATPISKHLGAIGDPFVERWVTWDDVRSFRASGGFKPGTVLVSRKRHELTNLFIPGKFTHAAIVSLEPSIVVEAVGMGVVRNSVEAFLLNKDEVVALEPVYLSTPERELAAAWAAFQIGKEYDYLFEGNGGTKGDRSFFCAELVYRALSRGELKTDKSFIRLETMGVKTVTPMDFVSASKKFHVTWKSARATIA